MSLGRFRIDWQEHSTCFTGEASPKVPGIKVPDFRLFPVWGTFAWTLLIVLDEGHVAYLMFTVCARNERALCITQSFL